MAWWKRRKERRAAQDLFLQSLISSDDITKDQAMAIPSIAQCVDIISSIAASLPVCLYVDKGDHVELVDDDPRVFLLNEESGNLLDSFQMKKAWVEDYLLDGTGYLYINRQRNNVKSIHYIDSRYISALVGTDPIFKTADIMVNGTTYRDFEFIRLVRRTKDGVTGQGIVSQNNQALAVMYNALQYENHMVKTGGNKKGFLKATERVEQNVIDEIRKGIQNLNSNQSSGIMVLNKGLEFQEASSTSVDMQLNENKKTNAREACKIFSLPPSILDGTATDEEWSLTMKICINPILKAMEAAFNQELLLHKEKRPTGNGGCFYFAIDTKELLKGDILKRFQAYQLAVESNIMQIDEVRYREDLPALNLDFIKLGLQDVLYNPKTKEAYTPNTNQTTNLNAPGESSESSAIAEPLEAERSETGTHQEEIAKISLNGAQISSILEIVRAVGNGEMELDSAITLLTTAFPFEEQDARRILGNPKALPAKGGEDSESGDQDGPGNR